MSDYDNYNGDPVHDMWVDNIYSDGTNGEWGGDSQEVEAGEED